MRAAYRVAARVGFRPVAEAIGRVLTRVHPDVRPGVGRLLLADALYRQVPPAAVAAYSPFHCVDVIPGLPRADRVLVGFRSLRTRKTGHGTVYHSPSRPTLRWDGREYAVGFSRHAAERIARRTVGDPLSFGGAGDAFAFLHDCVYFEPWSTGSGGSGFVVYNSCDPGFFSMRIAEEVLGRPVPAGRWYYRVGYCPAAVDGDFVVAKTLLTPGMRGTPEHAAVLAARLPRADRDRLLAAADRLTFPALVASGDFGPLRWFHEHGVPQVVALDREVFRHTPVGPPPSHPGVTAGRAARVPLSTSQAVPPAPGQKDPAGR